MPLKKVPKILSPDLLHALCSMGHGDEIVLADLHFPSSSICRFGPKEIRADGIKIPELLKAVLELYPLDQYVDEPVALMQKVPGDVAKGLQIPIWNTYQELVNEAENKSINIEFVERFAFYERAKKAYAIVHTGESSQYANIILKKGCVLD